jgi:precorrin-3B synthase
MQSGDGWIVRLQPPGGELHSEQFMALCELAEQFGSGVLELTNRGNLQLRGLSLDTLADVQNALHNLGCLPPADAPRQIPTLLNPDWQAGDTTHQLALAWWQQQDRMPELPAKFGVALDAGTHPMLSLASADIHIEHSQSGHLMVRLNGQTRGVECASVAAALAHLQALIHWFSEQRDAVCTRVRQLQAPLPPWHRPNALPASGRQPLAPGLSEQGWVLGVPMGQLLARTMKPLLLAAPATPIRITPWRSLLMPHWQHWPAVDPDPWICSANDPRSRIIACPGAPHCSQATVPTRSLALALAPLVSTEIHVSGCAKRCATRKNTEVAVVGHNGCYDLTLQQADGSVTHSGLSATDVLNRLRRH